MNSESIHQDPDFQQKKTAYFQDFMMRHLPQARMHRTYGLFVEKGSKELRNVVRHELLCAVMTETIGELLNLPEDDIVNLTNVALTHDVTKRR